LRRYEMGWRFTTPFHSGLFFSLHPATLSVTLWLTVSLVATKQTARKRAREREKVAVGQQGPLDGISLGWSYGRII